MIELTIAEKGLLADRFEGVSNIDIEAIQDAVLELKKQWPEIEVNREMDALATAKIWIRGELLFDGVSREALLEKEKEKTTSTELTTSLQVLTSIAQDEKLDPSDRIHASEALLVHAQRKGF